VPADRLDLLEDSGHVLALNVPVFCQAGNRAAEAQFDDVVVRPLSHHALAASECCLMELCRIASACSASFSLAFWLTVPMMSPAPDSSPGL
jgi:hypothetical protein